MPRASTPLMMPQAHVVAICPSTRHWQLCTTLYSAHTFKSKTLHNDCKASTTPQAFDPTVETVGLVWFWHNLEPSDVTVLPTKNRKCHGGFENMSLWINYFILGFLHMFSKQCLFPLNILDNTNKLHWKPRVTLTFYLTAQSIHAHLRFLKD